MNPATQDILLQISIWLIPGVLGIVLHEYAHGWVAECLGDPTARNAGRLSLNPVRHIDPVGTLVVPGLMLLAHMPFVFGWAKPVPVDFQRLKNGRVGIILVALAGPFANFLMMLLWLLLAWLGGMNGSEGDPGRQLLIQLALSGVAINLVLMLFNLIPIPPLDGGRVAGALLPETLARPYRELERYGIVILLVLIATGVFKRVFEPVLDFFFSLLGIP